MLADSKPAPSCPGLELKVSTREFGVLFRAIFAADEIIFKEGSGE